MPGLLIIAAPVPPSRLNQCEQAQGDRAMNVFSVRHLNTRQGVRDLNKASVLCCVVLAAIVESRMMHSSSQKECQTIAECRILNLHIYGFSASFPVLNRDLFCNKRQTKRTDNENIPRQNL